MIMGKHPRRISALCATFLALSVACTSPGGARLQLTDPGVPPSEPRGELRVALGLELDTLDPNLGTGAIANTVKSELFARLLELDNQANLVADLAREVPTRLNGGRSEDGLTYTFQIREGAVWSDGIPLVAEDFVYSFKRQLDPRVRAPRADQIYFIKGAEAYASAFGADESELARLSEAAGVRATGASTLVLELARPSGGQLQGLPRAVRRDLVEAYGDRWFEPEHFVGNGPFLLSEWVRGDHLTLIPNPLYHGDKPRVTKLTFVTRGPDAAWAAYRSGQLDLVAVPPGSRATVLSDPALGSQVIRRPGWTIVATLFNLTRPPFDNVKVRHALARAVDRVELIRTLEGLGVPATSWIAPGMLGYNPELGRAVQGFDPVAARRLLAEAGFPDGRGFPRLSIPGAQIRAATTEFVAGQLRANLGIEADPEILDNPTHIRRSQSRDFEMIVSSASTGDPDPDRFLQGFRSGDSGNNSGYSSPAYDAAFAAAVVEIDPVRRLARFQDAHTVLVEDSPAIFLYHTESLWLRQPHVRGLTLGSGTAYPGGGAMSKVWLDRS